MDKIKLRLCAGTMCYVMGGAQLMEIEELLSEEEKPLAPPSTLTSTGLMSRKKRLGASVSIRPKR